MAGNSISHTGVLGVMLSFDTDGGRDGAGAGDDGGDDGEGDDDDGDGAGDDGARMMMIVMVSNRDSDCWECL